MTEQATLDALSLECLICRAQPGEQCPRTPALRSTTRGSCCSCGPGWPVILFGMAGRLVNLVTMPSSMRVPVLDRYRCQPKPPRRPPWPPSR
jgi:hypothetical protein